jgi:hypothetical protein
MPRLWHYVVDEGGVTLVTSWRPHDGVGFKEETEQELLQRRSTGWPVFRRIKAGKLLREDMNGCTFTSVSSSCHCNVTRPGRAGIDQVVVDG